MKTLNAAIVTAVLALGLAGNAAAAPSKAELLKQKQHAAQTKKQSVKQPAKKIVVKKVVKQVVKKAPAKKVVQRTVRVKAGDTLSRIAKRNHTSVQKLAKLNGLYGKKANNLRVGMKIRIS